MDTTLGILKSHFTLGVANGATKPPEAASTWILSGPLGVASKIEGQRELTEWIFPSFSRIRPKVRPSLEQVHSDRCKYSQE